MSLTVSGYSYDPITVGGLKSEADYSAADDYIFMKGGASDEVVVLAGANALVVGVRMNKPDTGEAVNLAVAKVVPIRLGGTVAAWGRVISDAAGKAVASSTDKDNVAGYVLRGGVSGDIVPMMLTPGVSLSI